MNLTTWFASLDWATIVLSWVGSAGVLKWWETWATEKIKNVVKHEYDLKLESYKGQLQLAAAENHVRYSKLHENTVETISGTHSRLFELMRCLENYTDWRPNTTHERIRENRESVSKARMDLVGYYAPRAVFLPSETVKQIRAFVLETDKLTATFFARPIDQEADSDRQAWVDVLEKMRNKVQPLYDSLGDACRKILGFQDNGPDAH